MFREILRFKQALTKEEIIEILNRQSHGVLAVLGDDEYPYAIPLNYVYLNQKIYFHAAPIGHKVDALKKHNKVSFAVVDEDTIVSELYTSNFRSAIVFGKIRFIQSDETEWFDGLYAITQKYSFSQAEQEKLEKMKGAPKTLVLALDIEHMSGKEANDYARKNKPERYL